MKFLKRWWVLLIVVAIGIGGYAVASGHFHDQPAEKKAIQPVAPAVVNVTVDQATARPIRQLVTAVGSLWGWDEVPITPKLEGRVTRVHHDVGDIVKPGELLLEIDSTDFQLAVNEAKRALELELARLGVKELPTGEFDITKQPSVIRADSLMRQADNRIKRLQAGGLAVTDEEVQQAITDVNVAKANYQQALLELQATLASARQRQAMLDIAQQRLKDTKIVVPFPNSLPQTTSSKPPEYVISFRKVAEGEMVRIIPLVDAPPLYRLVIDQPLKLQLTLPERHRTEVKLGQSVELEVESHPNQIFKANISRINPAVDRDNRTFTVEILVPNEDRKLSAGSFAKANIVIRDDAQAVTVPEEAIVTFAGISKVFVLEGDRVRAVTIKPAASKIITEGNRQRTWVQIEGAIKPGMTLVTSGFTRLADGITVKVRSATEKQS